METSKKLKALLIDLQSGQLGKGLLAVKELKEHGTSEAIKPLIDSWSKNRENKLGDAIEKLFHNLKDTEGIGILINECVSLKGDEMQAKLLASLWNAGIDCSDYLQTIVEIGIDADYLTAVECMTIIENMEGPFEESELMESLINLRLAIEKQNENEPIYKVLLGILERAEREQ